MSPLRLLLFCSVLAGASVLGACGQTGVLYQPAPEDSSDTPAAYPD